MGLAHEGFEVGWARDGEEGLQEARRGHHDLLILDVLLPRLDGFQVCARLREQGSPLTILMLTAKDEVSDRVRGLNLGADDYLTKPFDLRELLARVRALLRRRWPEGERILSFADLTLNPDTHEVSRAGVPIELTHREFELLRFFLEHPGRVLQKSVLLDQVWGYDFLGDDNVVEVYVRYLRKKLGAPSLIQTLRGSGYALRVEEM